MVDDTKFEESVRAALARVDAPAGFADRVLQRAASRARRDGTVHRSSPAWRVAYAAAALVAVAAGGGYANHRRLENVRAAAAQQQFSMAIEMTNNTLDRVTAKFEDDAVSRIVLQAEEKGRGAR